MILDESDLEKLSDVIQYLKAVPDGTTNQEIAARLGLDLNSFDIYDLLLMGEFELARQKYINKKIPGDCDVIQQKEENCCSAAQRKS